MNANAIKAFLSEHYGTKIVGKFRNDTQKTKYSSENGTLPAQMCQDLERFGKKCSEKIVNLNAAEAQAFVEFLKKSSENGTIEATNTKGKSSKTPISDKEIIDFLTSIRREGKEFFSSEKPKNLHWADARTMATQLHDSQLSRKSTDFYSKSHLQGSFWTKTHKENIEAIKEHLRSKKSLSKSSESSVKALEFVTNPKNNNQILAKYKNKIRGFIEKIQNGEFAGQYRYAFGLPSAKNYMAFDVPDLKTAKSRLSEHIIGDSDFEHLGTAVGGGYRGDFYTLKEKAKETEVLPVEEPESPKDIELIDSGYTLLETTKSNKPDWEQSLDEFAETNNFIFQAEARELHKEYIQKALSEGKPVPTEVLAEYPELQPVEEPKNPKESQEDLELEKELEKESDSTKRLEILKRSLAKKEQELDRRFKVHFGTVKEANGQPLNDKRNGRATLNKWERQNDAIRNMKKSIEKTKKAIEFEEGRIIDVNWQNENHTPKAILDLVEKGELVQWRKHPSHFFVQGVEKGRIVWDTKGKFVYYKYLNSIPNQEQHSKFAKIFNGLKAILNDKVSPTSTEAEKEPLQQTPKEDNLSTQKEAWEMSFADFKKWKREFLGENYTVSFETGTYETPNGKKYNGGVVREEHYKAIKQALSEGKAVPAVVLAEYPDLQPVEEPENWEQRIYTNSMYSPRIEKFLGNAVMLGELTYEEVERLRVENPNRHGDFIKAIIYNKPKHEIYNILRPNQENPSELLIGKNDTTSVEVLPQTQQTQNDDDFSDNDEGTPSEYYLINSDAKVELHFDYDSYKNLDAKLKDYIKRYFLFSRAKSAWVSKAKYPNYMIDYALQNLKLPFLRKESRKTFDEKIEQKLENATYKQDRLEHKAAKAEQEADRLTSRFRKLKQDWAWVTQPNINTSGGRAFSRSRDKVMNAYEKGLEEYRRSEMFSNRIDSVGKNLKKYEDFYYLRNRLKEIESFLEKNSRYIEGLEAKINDLQTSNNSLEIAKIELFLDKYQEHIEEKAFIEAKLSQIENPHKEFEESEFAQNPKPFVKKWFKESFSSVLLTFRKSFKGKEGQYYYIETDKDLPESLQDKSSLGSNSKNTNNILLEELFNIIQKDTIEKHDNLQPQTNTADAIFTTPRKEPHPKKVGFIYVVEFIKRRVKQDVLDTYNNRAKTYNGSYSNYLKTFVFNTLEDAQNFVQIDQEVSKDYQTREKTPTLQPVEEAKTPKEDILSPKKELWEYTFQEWFDKDPTNLRGRGYKSGNSVEKYLESYFYSEKYSYLFLNNYLHFVKKAKAEGIKLPASVENELPKLLKIQKEGVAKYKALSEGKPVPAEVLAEYPDLQPVEEAKSSKVISTKTNSMEQESPKTQINTLLEQKFDFLENQLAQFGLDANEIFTFLLDFIEKTPKTYYQDFDKKLLVLIENLVSKGNNFAFCAAFGQNLYAFKKTVAERQKKVKKQLFSEEEFDRIENWISTCSQFLKNAIQDRRFPHTLIMVDMTWDKELYEMVAAKKQELLNTPKKQETPTRQSRINTVQKQKVVQDWELSYEDWVQKQPEFDALESFFDMTDQYQIMVFDAKRQGLDVPDKVLKQAQHFENVPLMQEQERLKKEQKERESLERSKKEYWQMTFQDFRKSAVFQLIGSNSHSTVGDVIELFVLLNKEDIDNFRKKTEEYKQFLIKINGYWYDKNSKEWSTIIGVGRLTKDYQKIAPEDYAFVQQEKGNLLKEILQTFDMYVMLTSTKKDFSRKDWLTEQLKKAHQIIIQRAISEGKPVPAEVLAEYPDLQPVEEAKTPKTTEKDYWQEQAHKEYMSFWEGTPYDVFQPASPDIYRLSFEEFFKKARLELKNKKTVFVIFSPDDSPRKGVLTNIEVDKKDVMSVKPQEICLQVFEQYIKKALSEGAEVPQNVLSDLKKRSKSFAEAYPLFELSEQERLEQQASSKQAFQKIEKIITKNPQNTMKKNQKERFGKIINVPISQIITRKKQFQNRNTDFSIDTYNKIINEGFDKSREPIEVLYDSEVDKYVVLSGHSRFAAAQHLYKEGDTDLEFLPVKPFIGTKDKFEDVLAEAIDYALTSNYNGTPETLLEEVKLYKYQVTKKDPPCNKDCLMSIFKENTKIAMLQDLMHLNENGNFLKELSDKYRNNYPDLLKYARWTGQLRKKYPAMSNSHENEIFDAIYINNVFGKVLPDKDRFFGFIEKRVNNLLFDPKSPLNLQNVVTKTIYDLNAETQISEIEERIKDYEQQINQLLGQVKRHNTLGETDKAEELKKQIASANAQITELKLKIVDVKKDADKANKSMIGIFDHVEEKKTESEQEAELKLICEKMFGLLGYFLPYDQPFYTQNKMSAAFKEAIKTDAKSLHSELLAVTNTEQALAFYKKYDVEIFDQRKAHAVNLRGYDWKSTKFTKKNNPDKMLVVKEVFAKYPFIQFGYPIDFQTSKEKIEQARQEVLESLRKKNAPLYQSEQGIKANNFGNEKAAFKKYHGYTFEQHLEEQGQNVLPEPQPEPKPAQESTQVSPKLYQARKKAAELGLKREPDNKLYKARLKAAELALKRLNA